ncbi:MAG: T9SS type A sorting domain-containing protein [Bacteroidetes bacterium]|nr:T9SS type A sorting domain-containing protein [Bacteroidota bacterium]
MIHVKTQLRLFLFIVTTIVQLNNVFSQLNIIRLSNVKNFYQINTNKQIDDNIYGFDVTDFFDNNPAQNDSIYYYTKELRPKIIRYQAPSDWYHFRPNSKRTGADTAEAAQAARLGLVDSVGNNSYLAIVRRAFNKDISYTKSTLYNLISYVKKYQLETGDTLKIIYSANAFQHMLKLPAILPSHSNFDSLYNETYNAVKLLKDSGLVVYGVELGNETYYQKMFYDVAKYPNANQNRLDYISILKQYSLNLKSQFPGIKVSVPMIWTAPINPPNAPGKLTAAIAKDNALFDAYSYHHYTANVLNPNNSCKECFDTTIIVYIFGQPVPFEVDLGCTNMNSNRFNCFSKGISDYLQPVGQGNSCNYYLYNELRTQRMNPAFNSYNKKIWLTEWGTIQSNIQNTIVYSDFVFRYINFLIDNQDSLNLGISNYWGLGGIYDDLTPTNIRNTQTVNTDQYSSLNPCSNTRSSTFSYMNQSGINRVNLFSHYYPLKFLSQIFSNNQTKPNSSYNLTLPNNTNVNADNFMMKPYLSKINTVQIGTTPGGSPIVSDVFDLYFYYSNKSDSNIYINYDSLNIAIFPPLISCIQGPCMEQFYSDIPNIIHEYIEAPNLTYYFRNSNYKKTGNVTQIKPRTVGYIKVPMYFNHIGGGSSQRQKNIIETKLYSNRLNVYPNPTSGIITFETNNNFEKNLEIFDISGKQIINVRFYISNYLIDMSSYPKAEYVYRLSDIIETQTGKFIVE